MGRVVCCRLAADFRIPRILLSIDALMPPFSLPLAGKEMPSFAGVCPRCLRQAQGNITSA
jgi:hypothetical protein